MASFNLADLFEGAAAAIPDQEAVVAGGEGVDTARFTYAELDARANRVAHYLASLGIGESDHVAVHLTNCAEFMEITLGIFKLRAVPINGNFRYTTDELRYVFEDAEVKATFTQPHLADIAQSAAQGHPVVPTGQSYEELLAKQPDTRPDIGERSGDDRYLLYTGGTTGMPKGVIWRHEDLFFGALGGTGAPRQGLQRLDDPDHISDFVRTGTGVTRRLPLCPLIHGGAQWIALGALLTGGTVLLTVDHSFDAASALRFASDEQAEFLMLIGDALARPLADELFARRELYDLSALKMISSSGAILSPSVKDALAAELPSTKIIDRYGASETGGQGRIQRDPSGSGPLRLLAGDDTTVLDENLKPVEPGSGVKGLLARRGWIPLGYWRDDAKTASAFPVIDGVRHSVPGDMATIEADGSIIVFGRGSMVINTGGEKVYPEEVEAAIKSHPAIFDALVAGMPDERFGQRVGAVISLREGHELPSTEQIAEHCREAIAGYKVPRTVIVTDAVQRKVTGKGDYVWARAQLEAGV